MQRCLVLAHHGRGHVAPNPMVGAVLVRNDQVLAEGWHGRFGGPHAEVECLRAFGEERVPEDAVLYVNLEPCSHHGKTPPCSDLVIARGVSRVVIGQRDPFPEVAGKGIAALRAAGVQVEEEGLEGACRWLQRRFNTLHERKRPHVVLKWARTMDGFIDHGPRAGRGVQRITGPAADTLVHRWRSEEMAIMVGARTVIADDPSLTTRLVAGPSPIRVVLDRNNSIPLDSRVLDGSVRTLLFTGAERTIGTVEEVRIAADEEALPQVLAALAERRIHSVLVEGGAELLGHFIRQGLWDEARVLTGRAHAGRGTPAPVLAADRAGLWTIGGDRLEIFDAPGVLRPAHVRALET